MKKNTTITPDRVHTGEELVAMGYQIDSDGFLIANDLMYDVYWGRPWVIKQQDETTLINSRKQ